MAIDYVALRETLLSRRKITARQYAVYVEVEDALPNDVLEGKTVLSLGWDGDAPGCSGANWVISWKGFYFCMSSDHGLEGPFESLEDALQTEWFSTVTPNPELNSEALPRTKLLKIGLSLVSEEGDEIYINGTRYVLTRGKLVKFKEEKA